MAGYKQTVPNYAIMHNKEIGVYVYLQQIANKLKKLNEEESNSKK